VVRQLDRTLVSLALIVCVASGAMSRARTEAPAAAETRAQAPGLPAGSTGFAEVAFAKGVELVDAGRFEEAVQLFRLAVELSPDVALYHEALGDAYVTLGGSDAYLLAKSEYRTALRLEPNRRRAREGLAKVALTTGRLMEALDVLESLTFQPGELDPQYLTDLVSLYIAADQADRGIAALGPHTRSPSTPPPLLLHLATLQRSKGGFDEALALAGRVRDNPEASDQARAMARELHAQWTAERQSAGRAPR